MQDKRYSRFIEVVKHRYFGAAHGLVTGICLVNSSSQAGDFLPLDYRIYALEQGKLTKNAHLQAMFANVVTEGKIQAHTPLFDAWCSGSLKVIHRAGWAFLTTLKSNRLVSASKYVGYQALKAMAPPSGGWNSELKASNGDIEWVVTNNLAFTLPHQMEEESHRSFKQLTGVEKY